MSYLFSMTSGDRIKVIREKKGLTQEALEKLSGVRRTQLSAYENNRIGVGPRIAKKIGSALGVGPEEILFGDHQSHPQTVRHIGQERIEDSKNRLFKEWGDLLDLNERDQAIIRGVLRQLKNTDEPKKKHAK